MKSTNRDIIQALRQGQLIALADETGWSVGADPQQETAVQQLLTLKLTTRTDNRLTVLAKDTDQVAMYVLTMPDVGYDLVEFADRPLVVIFDGGKNLAAPVIADGSIAIRKSLDENVQYLLGGFGKGLLTLPFESYSLPPAAQQAVAHTFGDVSRHFRKPRILRLGSGGEIVFIRQ